MFVACKLPASWCLHNSPAKQERQIYVGQDPLDANKSEPFRALITLCLLLLKYKPSKA
jgi:hypothetical protein